MKRPRSPPGGGPDVQTFELTLVKQGSPPSLGLTGSGGFISQPLAIVVIGGLVSSTILTLLVLPALYYLVEGAKERREEKRSARAVELEGRTA